MPEDVYRIGQFILNTSARELRSVESGKVVLKARNKLTLDLLIYLVRNCGRSIPTDKVLQDVWKNVNVGPDALRQRIHDLQTILLDKKDNKDRFIQTGGESLKFNCEEVDDSEVSDQARIAKIDDIDHELSESTYFRYKDFDFENVNGALLSRSLATRYARYGCEPICIGDQVFPVSILWKNSTDLIAPDKILGEFDDEDVAPMTSSPTLDETQYPAARKFIASIWQKGPVKHELREYCMTSIVDANGPLPRVTGRLGWYYDNILTQYGMEWELKRAVQKHGLRAFEPKYAGDLPLRNAVESGRNPLLDGTGRCTAITLSMLMVFARPNGLWTLVHRRSKAVGLSPHLLHVVPAGMFEPTNLQDTWSVESAAWREMLEEVYNEEEQIFDGTPHFDEFIWRKDPLPYVQQLLERGKAEFSVTGICCDLLNLRPEICMILYVPHPGLTEVRRMEVNWEYDTRQACTLGKRWEAAKADMQKIKLGEIVPSGLACFELARMWLDRRHGV